MTLARFTAEGQTPGTNITVANASTSGDGLTIVSPSNTTAITYSNTQAKPSGNQSARILSPTGTAHLIGVSRTANDTIAAAVDVYLTGYPTGASATLLQTRSSSAQTANILIGIDGKLQVTNNQGTPLATSTGAAPLNTWIHLDLIATRGTTTTDGVIRWNVTNASTTILNGVNTSTNTSTNPMSEVRAGKLAANPDLPVAYFDDLAADDGRTTFIGEAPTAGSATANAGPDKTTPVGTPVQLNGSAAGSSPTYAWTLLNAQGGASATLSAANTPSPTITPTAPGVLTYRLTVTAGGSTATDDAVVYVPATPATPIAVTANLGAWTNTGTSVPAALSDNDNATYIQSPDNPSAPATTRIRLAPIPTGTGFSIRLDHQLTAAGTGTATVTLYEGTVARKTWTLAPSTTLATTTLTLTDTELAAIGSLNALDVEFGWNV